MGVVVGLALFGVLIVVHELGHLLAGKSVGAKTPVFSIGMGPVVFQREWKGTDYRVSALPLGGYVLFDAEEITQHLPAWKRIYIFAAGPAANFALAGAIYAAMGTPEKFFVALAHLGEVVTGLLTGNIPISNLAGPVGIVRMAGESAGRGVFVLASFAAFLSLNLAVLNLLPIPVLDGGQILIAMLEGVIRRPLNLRLRAAIATAAWALLLGLFVYVTFGDIVRLWNVPKPVA